MDNLYPRILLNSYFEELIFLVFVHLSYEIHGQRENARKTTVRVKVRGR